MLEAIWEMQVFTVGSVVREGFSRRGASVKVLEVG